MAHQIKIRPRPHKNKDGSESKTKRDYVVVDRTRGGRVIEVGVGSTLRAAENLVTDYRNKLVADHLEKHPNDTAFKAKHGIKETENV